MPERGFLFLALLVLGAGWGVTQSLAVIAVSEGYRHFGLIFWQFAIAILILGVINRVRGRGLPLSADHFRLYLFIATIGTLVPNATAFQSAVHLPAGVLSIVLSLTAMLSFPIAMSLGLERFRAIRFLGLCFGLGGVALIALPGESLPDPSMVLWLPLALVAPLLYAFEGNYVARWGILGLDPVQLLLGASLVGLPVAGVIALLTGEWISPLPPWGAPDLAMLINSILHALVYSGYIWLVGRAGPVFAAQISYLVTGFGVLWAMLILSESYSGWVWAALALMFCGLFLVQPRAGLAERDENGQDGLQPKGQPHGP